MAWLFEVVSLPDALVWPPRALDISTGVFAPHKRLNDNY